MSHTLTWHGHSNFQITLDDGTVVLIDPFFTGNPKAAAAVPAKADLVCVTHDHGDHVGQAVEICQSTGAKLLSIVETATKLVSQGLPQAQVVNGIGINIGGTVTVGPVTITMVQAAHSSESGLATGYIFKLPGGFTLYHAGDTGLMAEMGLYGELFDIDLALIPIGGVFTMDPRQAALACKLLRAKAVTPMHYATFHVLEQNLDDFTPQLAKTSPNTTLKALSPGESLKIG